MTDHERSIEDEMNDASLDEGKDRACTIRVNISGLWNDYNFDDRKNAVKFIGYVQEAVKGSVSDPSAGFSAETEDEMTFIYGRHVVGYKIVRPDTGAGAGHE